jgi:hypothetical protein
VAAWVTAGDDVLLAQYDWQLEEDKEDFVGRDQELLEDTLRDLAKNIERGVSEELPKGMFLSFAAGLAIKRPKDDRIQQQLVRVRGLEHHAKNRWKTRASKKWAEMITRSSGEQVSGWEIDEGEDDDWIRDSRSNMVVEKTCDAAVADQEGESTDDGDERFERDDFDRWTLDLVNEAIDELGLEVDNLVALTSDLRRHYIEKHGESRKLVVLPPKKRGM